VPIGVYNNRKMTQFLGSDVVKTQNEQKNGVMRKNVLNKNFLVRIENFTSILSG